MANKMRHLRRAYLVRCWQDNEAAAREGEDWHFSVEVIAPDRRRIGVASLEALMVFLRADLVGANEDPPPSSRLLAREVTMHDRDK